MHVIGHADVIVIGAGIAGASVAYELAATRRVLLLERESQPGYHTTGRSAALFTETYGNAVMRALSRASKPLLAGPPAGFASAPLLSPRGTLLLARAEQLPALQRARAECSALVDNLAWWSAEEVRARVPCFAPGQVAAGLFEPDANSCGNLGRLQLELLRAVRLVTDTGIHAMGGTREEARSYMRTTMGDPQGVWVHEVDRYIVWPAQATGYLVGCYRSSSCASRRGKPSAKHSTSKRSTTWYWETVTCPWKSLCA